MILLHPSPAQRRGASLLVTSHIIYSHAARTRRRHNYDRQIGHSGCQGPQGSSGWLRLLSINHQRESHRRRRGNGANDVSWSAEEVAWWRTSVATSCRRGWIGETPSSSSKCWPLSTTGTLTCQERGTFRPARSPRWRPSCSPT